MKRECVSRYGYFNPEYRIGEDNDYWIRIIEHSIVAYVNLPLCIYKRTEKSITKNKELYYKSVIKVYLNYIEKTFYKLTNNVETMFHLRRVIGDGYFELAYYFYNLNLYNETVKYSMRSILWLYLKPKTLKIFFLGLFRIKRSVLEKLIRKL